MKINAAAFAEIRKAAGAVGVLTALVLLCVAGMLTADLFSLLGSEVPAADAAPVARAETPMRDLFVKTILTFGLVFSLAVVAPLVGALGLFLLLRRYGHKLAPLIRVEYPATPSVLVGPYTASSLGLATPAAESTAQRVVLGPTFEEERQAKDGLAQRQQAGVLQHLFEENLRLHQKIEHAKESEPPPSSVGRIANPARDIANPTRVEEEPQQRERIEQIDASGPYPEPKFKPEALSWCAPDDAPAWRA